MKYKPSLDGIRALAILSVMGIHYSFPYFEAGWLGVDAFFVLSGFLITTLLRDEFLTNGRHINIARFWGRRALRLLPIYWIYIGIMSLLLASGAGTFYASGGWTPSLYIASMWVYFINYAPGRIWTHQGFTFHLWSLSVEEQFYFTWPFLCILSLRMRRPWIIPVLLLLATFVLQFFVPERDGFGEHLYTRGFGILFDCFMALAVPSDPDRLQRWCSSTRLRSLAFGACTILACTASVLLTRHLVTTKFVAWWIAPILVALLSWSLAGLWYGPEDGLSRLLSRPGLVYLGKISYGLYLYHTAAWVLVNMAANHLSNKYHVHFRQALRTAASGAFALAIAAASFAIIEKPFLRLKRKISPRPHSNIVSRPPSHHLQFDG